VSVARRWVSLLAAVLLLPAVAAAQIGVHASIDPPQVQLGESAALSIEVQGAQNAPVPDIPAVDGLTVQYLGPATQVSIVNGRVTQSITHRYSVAPSKAGAFTIGPLAVTIGGQRYDAGSVTLNVGQAGAPTGSAGTTAGGEQLKLVLRAAKTELYLHERVPLSLLLYVGNVRVSDLQYPNLPGDGLAIDKLPEQPQQRREQTPQGAFQVVDFTTTLTPLRAGTLTVGPATMGLNQIVRGRGGDPFFGQLFGDSRRPITLRSDPLVLNVLPLPEANRPADFGGAVGRFEVDVKAGPLSLAAGDPVTVTTTIRGTGNLDALTAPAITGSDTLRVYPVQQGTASPGGGDRVFEQVVIPQRAGNVALPETRFSYFDPDARTYRTIVHPPIAMTVRPSAPGQAAPQIVGGGPAPARPESLGRDLVFIKDTPGTLVPIGTRRYRSLLFWSLQVIPLAAWLAASAFDRRRQRLTGDVRYARFTRAGRAARAAIAGARQKLSAGDHAAFYDAVARAVGDYLAAKLDLPPGGVTAEAVRNRFGGRELPPELARDLEEFLATCERARFAPAADASAEMQRTIERADAIVRALERERRLGRAVAAAALLVTVARLGWAAPATESPNTVFFRANTLYAEEHYAEAAAQYEAILAAGLESGNVHFNLGNAYFKAGDVGRAMLSYERARRLIPGDPDLLANLGYARSLTGTTGEPSVWARLLFPLAERFSSDGLLTVTSVLYTLVMGLLVLGRLAPAAARAGRVGAIGAGVGLALLVPSVAHRLLTVDLPTYAVVVAKEEATVRFEPAAGGTAHYQTKPGSVLRVLTQREGWAQVARDDGRRGWIEQSALATL
jgi:tetratricopeptide (TPR) repeat protein